LHSQSIRYGVIGGRARSFSTLPYVNFKKEIREIIQPVRKCYVTPIHVKLEIVYPIPKSYTKKKKQNILGTYKISTPDVDNIAKSILDAYAKETKKDKTIFEGLYEDDKLIAKLELEKRYTTNLEETQIEVITTIKEL